MVFSEYIELHTFVVSFALGLMLVYCLSPPPQIVHKFPTPENYDTVYRDEHNSCYRFRAKRIECDKRAMPQPIVENMRESAK